MNHTLGTNLQFQMLVVAIVCLFSQSLTLRADQREIAQISEGAHFVSVESRGKWGLAVTGAGDASMEQAEPVTLEFYRDPDAISHRTSGYDEVRISNGEAWGVVRIAGPNQTEFTVKDHWTVEGPVVKLLRKVKVTGTADYGFLTCISFRHPGVYSRSSVQYFAPGMIYGSPDHLSAAAIGGSNTYGPEGHGQVQIREDRLPAPMFGVHFADGTALTVLDPTPNGATTAADSHDTSVHTLVDARFQFGAVGVHDAEGHQEQGFWFPGTEGEVTYRGATYPGGQVHAWRRRYHPIRDGFTQEYQVFFRFSRSETFPAYYRNAWRWAYEQLKPPITWQNLLVIQRSLIDTLASQVEVSGNRAGISWFGTSATPEESSSPNHMACMGFVGKQIEAAELLLGYAAQDNDRARGAHNRRLGLRMIDSALPLRMNPPIGECFNIDNGNPGLTMPPRVYLRTLSDAFKSLVRTYRRERIDGYSHPEWLTWAKQFADWLLTQQRPDGGFPRAWHPGSGEVVDPSPMSSYDPIPFLVFLSQETNDTRYLKSAEGAGEFVWNQGQSEGQFIGGTIDNPNVLDKEAGTLSLEAYLALYEKTHDAKWLKRATAAADYAETYIYLWNVPMPVDEDDASLAWKREAPTYGTQLIATGHSLVDEFMSSNVPEYAKLARLENDHHYLEVATLLLHDTKNMTAIPGRTFDLNGPGWQQEHWSFAPVRGHGLHREWLPWVTTSQLEGMFDLQEFDPVLFRTLSRPPAQMKR